MATKRKRSKEAKKAEQAREAPEAKAPGDAKAFQDAKPPGTGNASRMAKESGTGSAPRDAKTPGAGKASLQAKGAGKAPASPAKGRAPARPTPRKRSLASAKKGVLSPGPQALPDEGRPPAPKKRSEKASAQPRAAEERAADPSRQASARPVSPAQASPASAPGRQQAAGAPGPQRAAGSTGPQQAAGAPGPPAAEGAVSQSVGRGAPTRQTAADKKAGAYRAKPGTQPTAQEKPAAGASGALTKKRAGAASAKPPGAVDAAQGRPRSRRGASGRRRWPLVLVGSVLALVVVALSLFSWNRWLRYDDASDFEGVWQAHGTQGTVIIDGQTISLTKDVAYSYTLDTGAKTIAYTFGTMEGVGRYRFSLDRQQLVITEGKGYTWLSTLEEDTAWMFDQALRAIQGKPQVEVEQSDAVTVLDRVSRDPAAAAARGKQQSASGQQAGETDEPDAAPQGAGSDSDAAVPQGAGSDAAAPQASASGSDASDAAPQGAGGIAP